MTGTLYHTPAEIIAQLLIDLGLANGAEEDEALTGWVVFAIHKPETPDQAILLTDTAGRLHNREMVRGITGEHYGIQVLTRSAEDPATSYKRLKLIFEYFDTQVLRELVILEDESTELLHTYRVNAITKTGPPIPSGNDGRRFFYAGNVITSIELVESESQSGTGS